MEELARVRESSDYELHRLTQDRPELLERIAESQAGRLRTEIKDLEQHAAQLAEEITTLTGRAACFGDA